MRVLIAVVLLASLQASPVGAAGEPQAAPPAPRAAAKGDALFGDFSLRSKKEPINVRADKLEFSYKDRVLTYSGAVVVTQADLTLKADVLTVTINDKGPDRLEQIIATGNVEISQGARSAAGGKAVFNQRERRVELTENAVLKEGPNQISGDRVIVYLDEERSVVEGGDKRVQALLFPGDNLQGLTAGSGKQVGQP